MTTITTAAFWKATAERAVSTAAQTAIGAIGATALVHEVDWAIVGSTVALATILSVLKGLAAGTSGTGPGFTDAESLTPTLAVVEQADPGHGRRADRDGVPDGRDTPDVTVEKLSDTATLTTRRYLDGTVEHDVQHHGSD